MSDLEFEDEDYSPSAAPASPRQVALIMEAADAGLRLDQALAQRLPEVSRSRLTALIKAGQVTMDGRGVSPSQRLIGVERVAVTIPPREEDQAYTPEAMPLDIVHEDADVLVLNKPEGLVVHPAAGNWSGTLLNGLLHFDPTLARVPRAGIVHRLDKDTSGLMVVARTEAAQVDLVRQLQARSVHREYIAIAQGLVKGPVRIDVPIGRHPRQRTKMAVVNEARGGKPAATQVKVIESLPAHSVIECRLETGRTHQIRVHLQSIGHPLEGDATYGAKIWTRAPVWKAAVEAFARQALHARRLAFEHPRTRKTVQFEAPVPEAMMVLQEMLQEGPR